MAVLSMTPSTTVVGSGRTGTSMLSLMEREETDRQPQFRSKSVAWKEPMLLFQRMSSGKAAKARSFRQKDVKELKHSSKPSKWARFWKKLRFDSVGKKVHAAQPEWLNYDSQSYAMNFEDGEMPSATPHIMPKISCPGARQIVTVILQRSPSTNRNAGGILIPKPVLELRPEANVPLWKRRSIQAPAFLDVKLKAPTKRRVSSGGSQLAGP